MGGPCKLKVKLKWVITWHTLAWVCPENHDIHFLMLCVLLLCDRLPRKKLVLNARQEQGDSDPGIQDVGSHPGAHRFWSQVPTVSAPEVSPLSSGKYCECSWKEESVTQKH